jgi:hypothetical protein
MDEYLFPPGTPEEFKAEFSAMIDRQKMQAEDYSHAATSLFDALSEEQLMSLSSIMHNIALSGKGKGRAVPAYYEGILCGILHIKYGVCFGCGKNHDREMQSAMTDSLDKFNAGKTLEDTSEYEEPPLPYLGDLRIGETGQLSLAQMHNMEVYNLDDVREEGSNVLLGYICKGCGLRYVTIEDRMLKEPGDCSGCIQKNKWG